MFSFDLTAYTWKTLVPMLLKIIAPTLALVIIFGIIKIILSRIIKERKARILIGAIVNIFALVAFVIVGIPLTQEVIRNLKYTPPDYDIISRPSSSTSISKPSNVKVVSAEEYFAPFFEAFEKEWAKEEEAKNNNRESGEDTYEKFKEDAINLWKEEHPDQELDGEEYQKFLKELEELWKMLQGDLPESEN